jgi:hypothetical protein
MIHVTCFDVLVVMAGFRCLDDLSSGDFGGGYECRGLVLCWVWQECLDVRCVQIGCCQVLVSFDKIHGLELRNIY